MVCFSIFLPLLKGEMPEGQREFRRKALPRCAGTISRCREVLPRCAGTISRCRGDLPKNSETCPLPNPAPRYPFCCFFRKFVSVIIHWFYGKENET